MEKPWCIFPHDEVQPARATHDVPPLPSQHVPASLGAAWVREMPPWHDFKRGCHSMHEAEKFVLRVCHFSFLFGSFACFWLCSPCQTHSKQKQKTPVRCHTRYCHRRRCRIVGRRCRNQRRCRRVRHCYWRRYGYRRYRRCGWRNHCWNVRHCYGGRRHCWTQRYACGRICRRYAAVAKKDEKVAKQVPNKKEKKGEVEVAKEE